MTRQRTLVIRIAAITLASDSAITIARFRLFKLPPSFHSVPSSRDPLHIKFENQNICNGHVNVTKINSKPKFPVTFT